MEIRWEYARMEAGELYQLHFQTNGTVTASGAKGQDSPERQTLGGQNREVYSIGDWLVESIQRSYGLEVLLRRRRKEGANPLELALQEGTAAESVNIRLLREPMESRTCQNVRKLTVSAVCVQAETWTPEPEKARTQPPSRKAAEPEPGPGPGKAGRGRPSPKPVQEDTAMALELQEARNQAQAAMKQLEASEQVNAQLKEQLKTMQARLEAERKRNAALRTADAQLSELLSRLEYIDEFESQEESADKLLEDLEAKAEELDAQVREAQSQAAKAEAALTEKRGELERLQSLEKLRTLDCGRIEKELSVLKEQLVSDGWPVALLKEEPFLDGPALEDLLKEAHGQVEKLETRIGEAVRLREKIDGMVQDAALRGNGMISLKKELG